MTDVQKGWNPSTVVEALEQEQLFDDDTLEHFRWVGVEVGLIVEELFVEMSEVRSSGKCRPSRGVAMLSGHACDLTSDRTVVCGNVHCSWVERERESTGKPATTVQEKAPSARQDTESFLYSRPRPRTPIAACNSC